MKHHKDQLKRSRGKVIDSNHLTWCKFEHFEAMYESVYSTMVKAGVARKLPSPAWFDHENNIVLNEEEAFGRKSHYMMMDPEFVLSADKTSSNTNQKQHGKRGGEMFVVPCTDTNEYGHTGATTDINFTVMCFSSATGSPMFLLLFS
jgi:hypothetical protein